MSRESLGRQSGAESDGPEEAGQRLFAAYETRPAFFDEMFEATGVPRAHCRELCEALDAMRPAEIAAMQEYAERSFLHQGITFAVYGEDGAQERIRGSGSPPSRSRSNRPPRPSRSRMPSATPAICSTSIGRTSTPPCARGPTL